MVLFEEAEAVEAALQAAQSQALVEWSLPESDEPTGVKGRARGGRAPAHARVCMLRAVCCVLRAACCVLCLLWHACFVFGVYAPQQPPAHASLCAAPTEATSEPLFMTLPAVPACCAAWVHEHKSRRPGNKALQQRLDEWVAAFEAEEERKERARTQAMAEDGWTVVTRGKGRAKTTEEGGMTVRSGGVAQAAARAKGDAKGGVKIEDEFYRFQVCVSVSVCDEWSPDINGQCIHMQKKLD
jgi:hypothetical protein